MFTSCSADFSYLPHIPRSQCRADSDPLWAYQEFDSAYFNDLRLTQRLQHLAHQFGQEPLASIPQACGNWANSKGAYRFCSNRKVTFAGILKAHYDSTARRIEFSPAEVILCPQDTTTFNHMAHPATKGLGQIGTKTGKSFGLLLHSTLAASPQGDVFGLLHAKSWARTKPTKSRQDHSRERKKLKQKETFRWLESYWEVDKLAHLYPEKQWVSVADREGDIYEVLQEATEPERLAKLLVRAKHDRHLLDYPEKTLFQHMRELPNRGTLTVEVPRQEGQPAREATLSIRFTELKITLASRRHKAKRSVAIWVVWAQEVNPPAGIQKPIQWCLLSTVPVHTLFQAIERIQWYCRRWLIEEWHRILKSGCRAEARQLTTRERLQRALAIDMVVAWRIMDLNKAARLEPDSPADRWLPKAQWQALYCYVKKTQTPPKEPPTIGEAVRWIAQLGGFLARKGDGEPGPTTIWRGLERLNDIAAGWQIFGPQPAKRPKDKPRSQKKPKRCG